MVSTVAPQTETTALRQSLHLWHLLSLDAPTVATLWTWWIARIVHAQLRAAELLSMFLAVWVLYAADRLLDARALAFRTNPVGLEARHLFHHAHRQAFRLALAVVCVALAALLPHALAPAELTRFLILGALLLAWFLIIHSLSSESKRPLPKEFVVGPFFAAAVFLPASIRAPHALPHLWFPAFAFAALCTLNCLFIAAWERHQPAHRITRAAANRIVRCAWLLALAAVGATLLPHSPQALLLPTALSTLLLLAVHAQRRRFGRTTLRALADLALLTPALTFLMPLLVLPWMR